MFFRGEATSGSLVVQYNNNVKMQQELSAKTKIIRSDLINKPKAPLNVITSTPCIRGMTVSLLWKKKQTIILE